MIEAKLEEIKRRRCLSHEKFLKEDIKTYKYISGREGEIFSDGELPGKVKDFIALGIAIIGNCESCIQYHIEDAMRKGATEKEILEIIDLCIFEGGSIAVIPSRFALEVLEHLKKKKERGRNK